MVAVSNDIVIEAWNTVLFDKFVRFKHLLVDGLSVHSEEALSRNPYPQGPRVLDVGCGFGDSAIHIAGAVGSGGQVTGVDCAQRFVDASRDAALGAGVNNVSFRAADVQVDDLDEAIEFAMALGPAGGIIRLAGEDGERLKLAGHLRDLALFNLAVDSKLRGCDLVRIRVNDIAHGDNISPRAMVIQRNTGHPVQFEVTEPTRAAVADWVRSVGLRARDYLFPAWSNSGSHLSTRQYGLLVRQWVSMIGLDPILYGAHSLRRTKVTIIYRRTKNLRAIQLLLGHRKLDSTLRCLGIEMEEALEIAGAMDV